MGKEREQGAGCRSCSLQGLTSEGYKPLQHLMPSATGPQSGRLHPQPTTRQSRGAAQDIWLHHPGVFRQLCYLAISFQGSCFLAVLLTFPTRCYHLLVPCILVPFISLGAFTVILYLHSFR